VDLRKKEDPTIGGSGLGKHTPAVVGGLVCIVRHRRERRKGGATEKRGTWGEGSVKGRSNPCGPGNECFPLPRQRALSIGERKRKRKVTGRANSPKKRGENRRMS